MDNLHNLQEIFSRKIFRIPDYQRGYSWQSQQLEEFWDDLLSLMPGQDHYTGMLSLKEVSKEEIAEHRDKWMNERWLLDSGYNYAVNEIVDGQQRMTTLIILINEIVSYCKQHNIDVLDDVDNIRIENVESQYLYKKKSDILKTYIFGYETDNPSYNYFRVKILNDPSQTNVEETFYTLNLSKAKKFFEEKLKNLSANDVKEIFQKITVNLKFNIYNIKDNFNVFVAFETMNNRGKRLSYLELLKNRLIYLSTLFNNNDESEKSDVRNTINDTWKEIYGYLGKNKSRPLSDDEFLQHHWMIYFGYQTRKIQGNQTIPFSTYLLNKYFIQQNIGKKDLASNIEISDELLEDNDVVKEINEDEEYQVDDELTASPNNGGSDLTLADIKKYVESLRNLIPYWYQTYEPSSIENAEISKYLFRLNVLGYVNARPLVTVLLSKNDISDEEKANTLKLIERFNFLYYRLNNYASTFNSTVFYNLARDFYYNTITIENVISVISENESYYLSPNNVILSDGPIDKISKLMKRDGYYSWGTLKYLLYIYDLSKSDGLIAKQKLNPDEYFKQDPKDQCSIEHIYPQTPTDEYWLSRFKEIKLGEDTKRLSDEERKKLNGSLGNMLPLSLRINKSLQNDSFDDKKNGTSKRRGYIDGSSSEMEVARDYDEWTPYTILARGMKLLGFMESEFDFKFPDDYYRKRLLGLEFMANKETDRESNKTEAIIAEKPSVATEEHYTEQEHLKGCTSTALVIYGRLRSRILELGDVTIEPKKLYLAFKHLTNICDIQVQSSQVKITINVETGKLNDPRGLAKDMETPQHIGHWGNGDYELIIDSLDDIDYVMGLIEQSYNIH